MCSCYPSGVPLTVEGIAPSSWAPRLTTLVYYAVSAGILLYVGFYVANRLLNFQADGLVTTRTIPIAPTREGRVAELPYDTGDTVRAGALLARVTPGLACQAPDSSRPEALQLGIRLDRARLEVLGEQIEGVRKRTAGLEAWAALELDMELRRESARLQAEILDLETEQRLLTMQVQLKEQALRETAPRAPDPRCQPDLVYAPFDATVHAVHHDVYSVVNSGEPVLSLKALIPPVVVVAYADPRVLPSLFPGKSVEVEFPDGTEATGMISAVRAAAQSFVRLDVEEYRLLGSQVLIEVVPADPGESERWRKFDRLGVRVTGRRGER